ncbi:hypothetical protein [Streptococcus infantis]|uniref:hypothetical protein n=1 Tax=Streptococcus infantis TaxID=68892 RepID=UPI0039C2044A
MTSFQLRHKGRQFWCEFNRLFQFHNTTIHVLVDHMFTKFTEGNRCFTISKLTSLNKIEGDIIYFLSFFFRLPLFPCILSCREESNLRRLRLLHWIQHDT